MASGQACRVSFKSGRTDTRRGTLRVYDALRAWSARVRHAGVSRLKATSGVGIAEVVGLAEALFLVVDDVAVSVRTARAWLAEVHVVILWSVATSIRVTDCSERTEASGFVVWIAVCSDPARVRFAGASLFGAASDGVWRL